MLIHLATCHKEREDELKILLHFLLKKVFSADKNRSYISEWNINSTIFWSLQTSEVPEGNIPTTNITRKSRVTSMFFICLSWRERNQNIRFHAKKNHLSCAFCTLQGKPHAKAVIILKKIRAKRKNQKRFLAEGWGHSCRDLKITEWDTEIRNWRKKPRDRKSLISVRIRINIKERSSMSLQDDRRQG